MVAKQWEDAAAAVNEAVVLYSRAREWPESGPEFERQFLAYVAIVRDVEPTVSPIQLAWDTYVTTADDDFDDPRQHVPGFIRATLDALGLAVNLNVRVSTAERESQMGRDPQAKLHDADPAG